MLELQMVTSAENNAQYNFEYPSLKHSDNFLKLNVILNVQTISY